MDLLYVLHMEAVSDKVSMARRIGAQPDGGNDGMPFKQCSQSPL